LHTKRGGICVIAIEGFTRQLFEDSLRENLSPAAPIRSPEHLRGREKKLEDIRRAMVQPGRSVFVYGDRGVGKTSLAQTAAFEHQSASKPPVLTGCDASSTFARVTQQIATRLFGLDANLIKLSDQKKGSLTAGAASAELQRTSERGPVPLPTSVDDDKSGCGRRNTKISAKWRPKRERRPFRVACADHSQESVVAGERIEPPTRTIRFWFCSK
jgi:AAA ATPase domain